MGWGGWEGRAYAPRPQLRRLSDERAAEVLRAFEEAVTASPVLSALGWTVDSRRGRFYFEQGGVVVGRVTPTGTDQLLLEVQGRSSWRKVATHTSPKKLVEPMASDGEGTFHGLGPLDAVLAEHGLGRLEMVATADDAEVGGAIEWRYLDLPPGRGPATVVEVLYHAFGVPIPVIAEPRDWWACHRTPTILEHRPDAVFVEFEQFSAYGNAMGGRCLYHRHDGVWDAYTIKPNQAETIETSLAWLGRRGWRAW